MELTRRRFGAVIAASLAALATGAWRLGSLAARACRTAACGAGFPGRLRRLDENEIRRPARWLG